MNKIIALLLTFVLGIWLPASAQFVGQAQTINDGGFPQWIQQDVFPLGANAMNRTFQAAFISAPLATTFTAYNTFPSITVSGTPSNANSTDGNWINYASAATTGSSAGIYGGPFIEFRQSLRYLATVETGAGATDLSDAIIWAGVEFGQNNATGTPSASTDMACFRYAPSVDGTAFWRVVTNQNGTSNVITTTYPIALGTEYTLAIDATGSAYNFFINGTLVASTSTDLPTNTTACYFDCINTTSANVSVHFKIKGVYIDFL